MAYTPCAASIAANIAIDCAQPIAGGYTGRAVLIPYSVAPTIVTNAQNPRKVESITLPTSAKVVVVDNVFADPFNGSNTTGSNDTGRGQFVKTFAFRIPLRGADVSRDIVEPLLSSAGGFLAVIEKNDKTPDGSFEVVGLLQPLKTDASTIARTESENGGDITAQMVCTEQYFECTLFAGNTYAANLQAFEDLLAKAF